jgi:integrase/recombinase XerD
MQISDAIKTFRTKQVATLKQSTQVHYTTLLDHLQQQFGGREIESLTAEEVGQFLESQTTNKAKSTRRLQYAQVKAFFNFLINQCLMDIKNPCAHPLIARQYKIPKPVARKILDKEIVDQLIYSTKSDRDRLMLELQARSGLRIGEVLKLRIVDVADRKLTINEPKSGKDSEIAFMPEQIAKRLAEYIAAHNIGPEERLFPVCYSTVRALIRRLAIKFRVKMSPHDFRRHSATYASRNGVPLEIVSKVILRHHDLKTTQVYLGKVNDTEAIRWMDVLHGK